MGMGEVTDMEAMVVMVDMERGRRGPSWMTIKVKRLKADLMVKVKVDTEDTEGMEVMVKVDTVDMEDMEDMEVTVKVDTEAMAAMVGMAAMEVMAVTGDMADSA